MHIFELNSDLSWKWDYEESMRAEAYSTPEWSLIPIYSGTIARQQNGVSLESKSKETSRPFENA